MTFSSSRPDLDAIARNLIALDLAHLTPEEAAAYERELSAIAALNDALEIADQALQHPSPPYIWQRLYPMLSDAAALLASQIAPLLDLNAERHTEMTYGANYFHTATRRHPRLHRRRYQHSQTQSQALLQPQTSPPVADLTLTPF